MEATLAQLTWGGGAACFEGGGGGGGRAGQASPWEVECGPGVLLLLLARAWAGSMAGNEGACWLLALEGVCWGL